MAEPKSVALEPVPDWFGLELAPFQTAGARALLSGKRLLADAPGIGKTRQALAAVAASGAVRVLIVCPPVVLHHWTKEVLESRVLSGPAEEPFERKQLTKGTDPDAGSVLVLFESGKKQPEIPSTGIVIVPDTLVSARVKLADDLRNWHPDVLVYDEAHRAKTWDSQRSTTMRYLADAAGTTFCLTGTPMFANPVELLPILQMTGYLEPVFGGHDAYTERFLRRNRYNQWVPRAKNLSELKQKLDKNVWLRRTKDEVLPDLPAKSRHVATIDVDLADYRTAHRRVAGEVRRWLASLDNRPTSDEISEWCRGQMGLVSMLRAAAGVCKVPAATEWVVDWLDGNPDRSLVVWTHHRSVSEAMVRSVGQSVAKSASIVGATPAHERQRTVADFQSGIVRLLVCSISAAGVGITLTRSSDALFVETDWTPALLTQAEDRICRIGQTRPVTITTLVAPGTLDEQVQSALERKARVLDAVLGESRDNHAEVLRRDSDEPVSILSQLVTEVLG